MYIIDDESPASLKAPFFCGLYWLGLMCGQKSVPFGTSVVFNTL